MDRASIIIIEIKVKDFVLCKHVIKHSTTEQTSALFISKRGVGKGNYGKLKELCNSDAVPSHYQGFLTRQIEQQESNVQTMMLPHRKYK